MVETTLPDGLETSGRRVCFVSRMRDFLCCSTQKPGGCEKNSVGYMVEYCGCEETGVVVQYSGETGRNSYSQGLEQQDNFKDEKEDSPLWKHLKHDGVKQAFTMKVLRSFSSCLERQVNEGVRITLSQAEEIMNSKKEFHQPPIVRVVATRGLHAGQGEDLGWVAGRERGGGTGMRTGRG